MHLAAAGVLVTATAEEARCHLVAGEVADAAQAELHRAGMLGVLADEDAETHTKHRQGNIDQTLGIAILRLEEAPLLIGERHDGGMTVRKHLHVDVEEITLEPKPCLGSGPEDVAVDLVLVDAALQQVADVFVDDRTVGVEGEGTCVAHHGGVEAGCFFQRNVVELARLRKEMADDFTRSTHRGLGDNGLTEVAFRVEMVVDEDARRLALLDGLLQPGKAMGLIQVADNDEVSPVDGGFYLVLMLLVRINQDGVGAWQPLQEVGKDVGYDDCSLPAFPLDVMLQGQCGTDGITIGIDMDADDNMRAVLY